VEIHIFFPQTNRPINKHANKHANKIDFQAIIPPIISLSANYTCGGAGLVDAKRLKTSYLNVFKYLFYIIPLLRAKLINKRIGKRSMEKRNLTEEEL
jgi:hypothetical protein